MWQLAVTGETQRATEKMKRNQIEKRRVAHAVRHFSGPAPPWDPLGHGALSIPNSMLRF